MSKWVNLKEQDNSIHRIAVLAADVTNDEKIVISYNDYTDGIHPGYAELIDIDGTFYKKYDQKEWSYYSTKFKDHDENLSNLIINALPDKIDLYIDKRKRKKDLVTTDEKRFKTDINKKTTAYFLTVIIYANRGDDLYVNDGYSNLPPIFFTRRIIEEDSLKEVYKRKNIDSTDNDELIENINSTLRRKMHVSTLPEDFKYELSSGNKYFVNFSSCDEEDLFCKLALADELKFKIDSGIKSGIYDDNLSSALHHELPLDVIQGNEVIKYEVISNNNIKGSIIR